MAVAKNKITTFGVTGSTNTWPMSIAHGAITGSYADSLHVGHGFVRAADGTITTFDPSDSVGTEATSINDHGATAGFYVGSIANKGANINPGDAVVVHHRKIYVESHGFVREADGTIVTFDPSGSVSTTAWAINDMGAVTGDYLDSSDVRHGYVRAADGIFTSFDPSGSTSTSAQAINGSGAITGWYVDNKGIQHGYARTADGAITILDPSGSTSTTPY
ncbi:MAG: hypothetical protein ACREHV_15875, partial [Rhizomicrobium sp.]